MFVDHFDQSDNWGGLIDNSEGFGGTLRGTDGPDTIIGSEQGEFIYGHGGDDLIEGKGANDWIDGGAGADSIDGGPGNDVIEGGTGRDILIAGDGHDIVFGEGKPYGALLHHGDVPAVTIGGVTYDGSGGHDVTFVDPTGGNDILFGGNGNDVMYGQVGDDTLIDLHGANLFNGGMGRDLIISAVDDGNVYATDGLDSLLEGDTLLITLSNSATALDIRGGGGKLRFVSDSGWDLDGNQYTATDVRMNTALGSLALPAMTMVVEKTSDGSPKQAFLEFDLAWLEDSTLVGDTAANAFAKARSLLSSIPDSPLLNTSLPKIPIAIRAGADLSKSLGLPLIDNKPYLYFDSSISADDTQMAWYLEEAATERSDAIPWDAIPLDTLQWEAELLGVDLSVLEVSDADQVKRLKQIVHVKKSLDSIPVDFVFDPTDPMLMIQKGTKRAKLNATAGASISAFSFGVSENGQIPFVASSENTYLTSHFNTLGSQLSVDGDGDYFATPSGPRGHLYAGFDDLNVGKYKVDGSGVLDLDANDDGESVSLLATFDAVVGGGDISGIAFDDIALGVNGSVSIDLAKSKSTTSKFLSTDFKVGSATAFINGANETVYFSGQGTTPVLSDIEAELNTGFLGNSFELDGYVSWAGGDIDMEIGASLRVKSYTVDATLTEEFMTVSGHGLEFLGTQSGFEGEVYFVDSGVHRAGDVSLRAFTTSSNEIDLDLIVLDVEIGYDYSNSFEVVGNLFSFDYELIVRTDLSIWGSAELDLLLTTVEAGVEGELSVEFRGTIVNGLPTSLFGSATGSLEAWAGPEDFSLSGNLSFNLDEDGFEFELLDQVFSLDF